MKTLALVLMNALLASTASAALMTATPRPGMTGNPNAGAWAAMLGSRPGLAASLRLDAAGIQALTPVLSFRVPQLELSDEAAAGFIRKTALERAQSAVRSAAANAEALGPRDAAFRSSLDESRAVLAGAATVLEPEKLALLQQHQASLEKLPRYVIGRNAVLVAEGIARSLDAMIARPPLVFPEMSLTLPMLPPLAGPAALPFHPRDPRLTDELAAALGLDNVTSRFAVVRDDGRSVYISGNAALYGGLETRSLAMVDGQEVILRHSFIPNPGLLPYYADWTPDQHAAIRISRDGGRTWELRPGDRTVKVLPPPAPLGAHPALPAPYALPPLSMPLSLQARQPAPSDSAQSWGAIGEETARRHGLSADEARRARPKPEGGVILNIAGGSDARRLEQRAEGEVIVRTIMLDNGHMMPSIFRDESSDGGRTWQNIPEQRGPSTASGRGTGHKPGWKRYLE